MNKFHYYAISTASADTYPDNKGGLFKNNLANSINLEGEWEVGVGSITCKEFDVSHLHVIDPIPTSHSPSKFIEFAKLFLNKPPLLSGKVSVEADEIA